jgi:hypothetical protein
MAFRGDTAAPHRPRLLRELTLLGALYGAYSVSRAMVGSEPAEALTNAARVLAVQDALGLSVEAAVVAWVTASTTVSVVAAYVYATLHYTVTPAVLVWMWRRRPQQYAGARTVLLLATGVALACYWVLPVAPPRLLDVPYPDVLALTSSWGWWGAEASAPRGLGSLTNQYAAMPSMHVGWAVWCGLVVFRHSGSRLVRGLAVAYPLLVSAVVIGTGNHFLLDAVAGAAVVAGAAIVLRRRTSTAAPAVPAGSGHIHSVPDPGALAA